MNDGFDSVVPGFPGLSRLRLITVLKLALITVCIAMRRIQPLRVVVAHRPCHPAFKVFFACVLMLGATLPLSLSRAASSHPQDMACQSCHRAAEVTRQNARPLQASQEQLCGRCHTGSRQISHPTGFTPGRRLPPAYPLDGNGQMACSTCHDVHGAGTTRLHATADRRTACLGCHAPVFFSAMADRGSSIQGMGHQAVILPGASGALDASSRQCLACHGDEHRGNVRTPGTPRQAWGANSHPVGMRYDEAVKNGLYHPAAKLDPAILLPGGKVGCVSCHRGYSQRHGALVRSNLRSALCLSCHDS